MLKVADIVREISIFRDEIVRGVYHGPVLIYRRGGVSFSKSIVCSKSGVRWLLPLSTSYASRLCWTRTRNIHTAVSVEALPSQRYWVCLPYLFQFQYQQVSRLKNVKKNADWVYIHAMQFGS